MEMYKKGMVMVGGSKQGAMEGPWWRWWCRWAKHTNVSTYFSFIPIDGIGALC